jgi:hypothetical protein
MNEKSLGSRPLGRPRKKWEVNFNIFKKKMATEDGDWEDMTPEHVKITGFNFLVRILVLVTDYPYTMFN